MGHNHGHGDTTGRSLLISVAINFLIPVAQIVGGIYAGSMALISDAIHNLSDFTALLIAYFAHVLGKRTPTPRHTFGLVRIEIVAAAVNAAFLGGTAVFIAIEAIKRLSYTSPIDTKIVAILAFVGILGNGLSAFLLHENSAQNLNVRGAFLHMMGDLMTSVVVLVGAAVMYFKPWPWVDPVLSLMIVAYIVINCLLLLKESVHVLMDGTPLGLDVMAIKEKIEDLSGVRGIHHLHAWLIGGDVIALTCHVVIPDQPVSATETLSHEIRETLEVGFNVTHTVFQFESKPCGHGELLCRSAGQPDHDAHECDLG